MADFNGFLATQILLRSFQQSKIRGCDAVYVALAECHLTTLITLDRQQMERAPAHVSARTLAKELANMGA